MPPSTWGAPTRPLSLSSRPVFNLEGCRRTRCQSEEKGPAARRRPKAAREAYFLYVERAAEGANEADGPLSSLQHDLVGEDSDALDLGLDAVAGLQVVAAGRAHPVGRAGGDDVARQDRH